eukprot:TRINITY_DN4503_c0_g1_i4.p1 TRINITY_DN4503_c0_g1~~TRINITY_DN4503_c0_g1_i4.p1  ORF type:complete len:214 (+),score=52.50 TRINITY_DN4503_c0_g1_i4:73-642(+)
MCIRDSNRDVLRLNLTRENTKTEGFKWTFAELAEIIPALTAMHKHSDEVYVRCRAHKGSVHPESKINKLLFDTRFNCTFRLVKNDARVLKFRVGVLTVLEPSYNRTLNFRVDDIYAEFQGSLSPEYPLNSSAHKIAMNQIIGNVTATFRGRRALGSGYDVGQFDNADVTVTNENIVIWLPRAQHSVQCY